MEKTIYLEQETSKDLHTSENYEEWAGKFFNLLQTLTPSFQICQMIINKFIDSQIHREYYGHFASWLGSTNTNYRVIFEEMFKNIYKTNSLTQEEADLHRIYEETKFFAILFYRDSISWNVLSCIELKENSPPTREYFVTLLLLELSRNFGKKQLCDRLKESKIRKEFEGFFPKDKLENTLYAIKMFELVNLHDLTHDLHEYVNLLQNEELNHKIQKMSL